MEKSPGREWWKLLPQSRIKKTIETKKKLKINENSLRDLWDSLKHTNIHVVGVLEREQRKDLGK